MKKNIVRNGLVVGIIALFICIGIQPVLSNEVTIPTISNSEEDCDCNIPNAKLHLVEKLLKNIEKNEELLKITNSYEPQLDRPLCTYLWDQITRVLDGVEHILYDLAGKYPPHSIMWYFYCGLALAYSYQMYYYLFIGTLIFCWGWPPYY